MKTLIECVFRNILSVHSLLSRSSLPVILSRYYTFWYLVRAFFCTTLHITVLIGRKYIRSSYCWNFQPGYPTTFIARSALPCGKVTFQLSVLTVRTICHCATRLGAKYELFLVFLCSFKFVHESRVPTSYPVQLVFRNENLVQPLLFFPAVIFPAWLHVSASITSFFEPRDRSQMFRGASSAGFLG